MDHGRLRWAIGRFWAAPTNTLYTLTTSGLALCHSIQKCSIFPPFHMQLRKIWNPEHCIHCIFWQPLFQLMYVISPPPPLGVSFSLDHFEKNSKTWSASGGFGILCQPQRFQTPPSTVAKPSGQTPLGRGPDSKHDNNLWNQLQSSKTSMGTQDKHHEHKAMIIILLDKHSKI